MLVWERLQEKRIVNGMPFLLNYGRRSGVVCPYDNVPCLFHHFKGQPSVITILSKRKEIIVQEENADNRFEDNPNYLSNTYFVVCNCFQFGTL